MNILFFIVHPSKYHLFKHTINKLIGKGHHVDLCITSKDVLEDLVRNEGWSYTNIFPEGRVVNNLPRLIGTGLNFIKTLWRLFYYTENKKYDLFITDDVLGIIGRIRNISTIHFVDDDISVFPQSSFLLRFVTNILAPNSTDLGIYENKRIGFDGFKQSAYLRPNQFIPSREVVEKINPSNKDYFVIRLVSLSAAHDIGKGGISNELLANLIKILQPHGCVFISAERELDPEFEKYRLPIESKDLLNIVYYANILICDSQTMAAEAGLMGTPFIRYNDFIGKIGCLNDLELKFKLGYGVKRGNTEELFDKVNKLLGNKELKEEWQERQKWMLDQTIDLAEFMTWLFENYPSSVEIIDRNPDYQLNFK